MTTKQAVAGYGVTVLVCGSRTVPVPSVIRDRLWKLMREYSHLPRSDIRVLHGGARGADTIAGRAAVDFGYIVEVFRADWTLYGRRAGILRNLQMLDQKPDRVIAFWDGTSPGTKHTIGEARRRGIDVEVISIAREQ